MEVPLFTAIKIFRKLNAIELKRNKGLFIQNKKVRKSVNEMEALIELIAVQTIRNPNQIKPDVDNEMLEGNGYLRLNELVAKVPQ